MPAIPLRLETLPASAVPGRILEGPGVVNTGYRPGRLEISIPSPAAQRLGLWPNLPSSAVAVEILTAGGKCPVWSLRNGLRVRVQAADRSGPAVDADVLINPADDEILVSGILAGALRIALVDLERDTWRFADEPYDRQRPSEPYRSW